MNSRATWGVALGLFCQFLFLSEAAAWVHVAQAGETLDQLAVRYYGAANYAIVIRAANGFVHPDDGRLTPGERIEIPENEFHRVTEQSDDWGFMAERYLGSAARGPMLAELNGFEVDKLPPEGTIIKIPYHVLHIFATGESLKSVASLYYDNKRSSVWLQKYNFVKRPKFTRGTAIIVPLIDLEIREEERRRIDELKRQRYSEKDKERQDEARTNIAKLKDAFAEGRYIDMVAIAANLLGNVELTVPQEIGIRNYQGFAYVALDEKQLALEAFKRALQLQPVMELSPITTSPKILEIFNKAREEVAGKDMGDAGPAPSKGDKKRAL